MTFQCIWAQQWFIQVVCTMAFTKPCEAQFNKMQLICEKLQLKKGEKFLILLWLGNFNRDTREFVIGTGVTLSVEGKHGVK